MICPHRSFPLNKDGSCPYHGLNVHTCFKLRSFEQPPEQVKDFDANTFQDIQSKLSKVAFYEYSQKIKAPGHIWMQNTADYHHVPMVHKEFSKLFCSKPYDIQISQTKKFSSHKLKVCPEKSESYRRMLKDDRLPDRFLHVLQAPYISYTSFMDAFFSVEKVIHDWNGECIVTTKFYTNKELRVPNALKMQAMDANRAILKQDKAICEAWAGTGRVTGNWLKYEERIKAYCEYMEEWQKCNQPCAQ